jgi:hypothetical protein
MTLDGRDKREQELDEEIIEVCINNAIIGVALKHLCRDRKVVLICCRTAGDVG